MLKNFFKKKVEINKDSTILIPALLIHAAKIDENYTAVEKKIITKAIMDLNKFDLKKAEQVMKDAEKKEEESNQIIEFTQEIKKYPIEFRLKIIEIIWKIVYSDGENDSYESTLIRRICGLLYVSDKDNGVIKERILNQIKSL
ncbi:TerB family tellurite resistance protein [Pelagibacteraceae bacterium]|nr:TerB family tellurite resistance protein [Pelagibacteraceae bacterium]